MSENAYGLLLAFDTDDPSFVRGFEAGRIWEILKNPDEWPVVETVHATNAEMMLRIAEALDLTVQSDETDDDARIHVTFAAGQQDRQPK